MSTAPPPNSRASLLAGLRTGGVRSVSASFPQTAGPTATSFSISPAPRFVSQRHQTVFPEEEEYTETADLQPNLFASHHGNGFAARNMPMTAAVDGPNHRFAHQQNYHANLPYTQAPMNAPMTPNVLSQPAHLQQQALQMQMMQLEIMRIQAVQAQQYQAQAELIAQAQQRSQQAQAQARERRVSLGFNPPASAGPLSSSFDLRSATLSAQARRVNQADLSSHLSQTVTSVNDDQAPMTAALGGRFGSRTVSLSGTAPPSRLNSVFHDREDVGLPPPTPNSTTVISGGTSLGKASAPASSDNTPSKSDVAISWRRSGNNSVLSGPNRSVTSPSVHVTPPPGETLRKTPPPVNGSVNGGTTPVKTRPQPLRFSMIHTEPIAVAIGSATSDPAENEQDADDASSTDSSTKSAASNSSPTTSHSSSESPLSPREEATKKLYEGLGIGRPAPSPIPIPQVMASHRMASQPVRQPRGPPSGLDELGPKNFATRIRRQAIGGLGMLMGARERREVVEAF